MEYFYGTSGDDDVKSPTGPSTYYLRGGNDIITGVSEPRGKWGDLKGRPDIDVVYLGNGDDTATGFNENDAVYGGRGNDVITASGIGSAFWPVTSNHAHLYGDEGDDSLTGANHLVGGRGNDTLVSYGGRADGGPGNDVYRFTFFYRDLIDREGASVVEVNWPTSYDYEPNYLPTRIVTGDGMDRIVLRGLDNCTVRTGDRADYVDGGGFNTVYAGGGNDTVVGAGTAYGANGRDVIRAVNFADGGRGADDLRAQKVDGGAGNDTIEAWQVGHGDAGADFMKGGTLHGGDGNDTINANYQAFGDAGADLMWGRTLYGGDGNDTMYAANGGYGEAGDDLISGKVLYGGDGDDTLDAEEFAHGEAGDDFITGGGELFGDNGDDTLAGTNATDDTLDGGRGADELRFALYEGSDVMRGGGGPDIFVLTAFEPDDLPEFIDSADSIEGFEHGLDLIDLRARDGVDEFADLTLEQVGNFTKIEDAEGYLLVVVVGDDAANFAADDFIF